MAGSAAPPVGDAGVIASAGPVGRLALKSSSKRASLKEGSTSRRMASRMAGFRYLPKVSRMNVLISRCITATARLSAACAGMGRGAGAGAGTSLRSEPKPPAGRAAHNPGRRAGLPPPGRHTPHFRGREVWIHRAASKVSTMRLHRMFFGPTSTNVRTPWSCHRVATFCCQWTGFSR